MFSRFFKRIGNVLGQYLQKESPYMIAIIIIYIGLMND
jgi:putative Mn2+ efflux pump MntP